MKRIVIYAIFIFMSPYMLYSADYSLPTPPHEFFDELSRTIIPPGKSCCNNLRDMLGKTVSISPYLAAKLFQEGKLIIGDARTVEEFEKAHIFGAISLPYNKVDFMKLKPIKIPVALY